MRVLHLSAGAVWGGVERALVTLARERSHAPEMHPHFAVCFRDRLSQELRLAGSPVDYLGEVRASRPFTIRAARRALRTVLAQEKIDVAITHLPWAHAMFAPVLRETGTPVAFWMHGFATGRHWTERWARLTPPAIVIANSNATVATAPKLFPKTPSQVLRYPVSVSTEPRAETPGAVLQVSRMEPWKGHKLLLDALALLKNLPGWHCSIAGGAQTDSETAYETKMRLYAIKLGLTERVDFLGQRSDVDSLLAAASLFCQPNLGPEPFGIVFIEALAAGLPVITTRLGAAPEIIDDTCGILTEPGDPAALASALRRLLADTELRNRLSAAGPSRAALLCSPERQLPALAQLLRKVKLESQAT